MMAKWMIDWRIEGSVTVEAKTAEEAQEIFDWRFGEPGFASHSTGEVSNDEPYRVDGRSARSGARS
jgi:hypothetical protein